MRSIINHDNQIIQTYRAHMKIRSYKSEWHSTDDLVVLLMGQNQCA